MDPLSAPAVPDSSNPASTSASNLPPTLSLVIVTTSSTYVYPILPKPSSPTAVLVDEIGAGLRCACIDWKSRWVVLGRDEAVVGIGSGGRLGVVSYEGKDEFSLVVIHLIELPRTQVFIAHTPQLRGRRSPVVDANFCGAFLGRRRQGPCPTTKETHD